MKPMLVLPNSTDSYLQNAASWLVSEWSDVPVHGEEIGGISNNLRN